MHYAAEVPGEHFLAALDLRDVPFAGARRPQAAGVWPRVAERARSLTGTVVISHEVFAPAPGRSRPAPSPTSIRPRCTS